MRGDVARVGLADAEARHDGSRLDRLRIADPAHEVLRVVSERAGDEGAAREARERRTDRAAPSALSVPSARGWSAASRLHPLAAALAEVEPMKRRAPALAVPILALATLVLTACEPGRAPADWAARNRLTTGDPKGPAQPVDPKDAHAQDVRPGQEEFWTTVIAGLIIGSALAVGAGAWYFEARRRARRRRSNP